MLEINLRVVQFSFMKAIKHPFTFFSFIPLITFSFAYLRMALVYKTPYLFNVIVHENGKYTLLETILYYDHFCRELFISAFLALFVVEFFLFYGSTKPKKYIKIDKYIVVCFFALALFLIIVLLESIHKVGLIETNLNLFQYRIRDDLIEFGSHWRYHFLSRIGLFTSSATIIILYRAIYDKTRWMCSKYTLLILVSASIGFIVVTILFGITNQPFNDPKYLAHQGREFITHNLFAIPILIALLYFLEEKFTKEKSNHQDMCKSKILSIHFFFWFFLSILIPSFLWLQLKNTDISLIAQQNWSMLDLLAFHFFEHFLDCIFIAILGMSVYLLHISIISNYK